jgi:hypothetical protein
LRAPRHLADRKVDTGEVEQAPISSESRAHWHSLNLEAAARIRDALEGRNSPPDVELVDGGQGPPSALLNPTSVEFDPALWDKQARSASGKYSRKRRSSRIV